MDQSELAQRLARTYEADTVLFHEGEQGSEMYVVQEGEVRISKNVGGRDKTLAVLGPGEFFGEMAILNRRPRTATATVVTEARLLVIDSSTFEAMVEGNTEITVRLIRKLADRLEAADKVIEILLHRDPRARVILGLSSLARERGEVTPDGVAVDVDAGELADHVGLDAAMVRDVLERLVRAKMIEVGEGDLVLVRDVERMQEFMAFLEMNERFGDL